jgi:hypothetical protein
MRVGVAHCRGHDGRYLPGSKIDYCAVISPRIFWQMRDCAESLSEILLVMGLLLYAAAYGRSPFSESAGITQRLLSQ